jgi:hypothetical protein
MVTKFGLTAIGYFRFVLNGLVGNYGLLRNYHDFIICRIRFFFYSHLAEVLDNRFFGQIVELAKSFAFMGNLWDYKV